MKRLISEKPRRTIVTLLSIALFLPVSAFAKEGIKVPPTVKESEKEMLAAGLEIPVELLYNDKGTGLNNAVVLFGKGCTGEIISGEGLLLTNHHCGYGTVQGLASANADYFANGFWAGNTGEEIPCPGLTVTFIRGIENVTEKILYGVDDEWADAVRDSAIQARIRNLEKGYRFTTKKDAAIKAFANGNQYWVMISETFSDIRLVGFPPNGIGQFGGDTDNWSWPRHTGDFSLFRVYAGPDNKPAPFQTGNVPYKTKNFFTINTNGYKENDFTLVYGFPGLTQEYISSMQLNQIVNIIDPIRIDTRTRILGVWSAHMEKDRNVFLKYTSKKARLSNGWKKWQGEVKGLTLNNAVEKKRAYEQDFQAWANSNDDAPGYSKDLLFRMQANISAYDATIKASEYIREAVLGIELIANSAQLDKILQLTTSGLSEETLTDSLKKLRTAYDGFYKNYDVSTDKDVFIAVMPLFMEKGGSYVPEFFKKELARFGGSYTSWANYVFKTHRLDNPDKNNIEQHPAWRLYAETDKIRKERITPYLTSYQDSLNRYNRLYMKARMLKSKYKSLYPDANGTLRITYGKVKGIDPDGPAKYSWQTNLDEAVEKHNPDVSEFKMPEKLLELHHNKDYGRWAVNGTVPIAFIADNHTSGGNSGSPVLNAKGELIGTNFDRVWEGTMSDYYFDERWCRNISLDIRYTLFIIEKLGGAGWLLKEIRFADSPR